MQAVIIKNTKLLNTLTKYSDFVMSNFHNINQSAFDRGTDGKLWQEVCSEEYLNARMKLDPLKTGFPIHLRGWDSNSDHKKLIPNISKQNEILDSGIMDAIGVQFCALKAIYPADGYIDWHNNCNCPGQNLIMSYSKSGNGCFKYYDIKNKEIVVMNDKPGWTAKVGYYGSFEEPEKIVWHCAMTLEPRITVSYVIRDQYMWEDMVYDIEHDID